MTPMILILRLLNIRSGLAVAYEWDDSTIMSFPSANRLITGVLPSASANTAQPFQGFAVVSTSSKLPGG